MIYEIRTYQVKVGSLAEVEKRFGEAYEYRKKYSPLAAFLHTEIGPLNEIVPHLAVPGHGRRARAHPRRSGQGHQLAAEDPGVHSQDAVGSAGAFPVRARDDPRQDGAGVRAALLRHEGRHAARSDQALGREDR